MRQLPTRFTAYPFTLGVASGEPLPTGVVLWTRLAPDPVGGGGAGEQPIDVSWEVAEDEAFAAIVARGTAVARPQAAHSVHVEVAGLQPARWYFYRFTAAGEVSPVGRTRTLPATGVRPERVRFGLGSCQHFEQGFYAAHRHLTGENLELMVFVGDYIYEGPGHADGVRRHADGEVRTLAQYRNRHAQYKTDGDLQALHAAVPWLMTWDDHEVDNNYARLRSETLDPDFARRRAAAYRAYYEHMPLRRRAMPTADGVILRSRHDVGALARFHLLDGRQRRTPQACPLPGRGGARMIDERCPELLEPGRSMLGPAQERWLANGLRDAPGRWHFIAEATLVARAAVRSGGRTRVSSDAWDGYPAARRRLLGVIANADLGSCVFVSGDAHTAFVSDLRPDFNQSDTPPVATEFCGTSLTSRGPAQRRTDTVVRQNPHIHFGDSAHRGYVVLETTAERCTATMRALTDPRDRNSGVFTRATFEVDAGRPGARRV